MPTPSSFAIARQGVPEARSASILDSLTNTRGRPSRTPFAFALRRPARTRSWIRARSNSAMAPMIWNISRPAGVVRSKLSRRETKAIPQRLELGQRIHQVLQGSGESVELPDEQDIELPALSSGHHLVESRATILRSAYAAVHILTDDLPTAAFDKFAQFAQLHFRVLMTICS